MAKKRTKSKQAQGDLLDQVQDYRHESSKRSNNPPAKLAAEGTVPVIPKARYYYSPHRPPELRFDPTGAPDALPELIEAAKQRALTDEEAQTLAEALCEHQPWLEWATKREQHEQGWFGVEPVALHIHERVSAQAILRVAAREDAQRDLFADPQLEYHEAVQFYRHDVDWANRMILGDSLQVMSSLARREDLAGKVQMIYIDPPYGIKFSSNFQPEVGRRDVKDKEADLTREPEMVKAYRDTWHLGIHSYLSYLRDRLIVARELLADTGSIFVQINDENLHRVRHVMDEILGAENHISQITVQKTGSVVGSFIQTNCDYLLWYARDRVSAEAKYRAIYRKRSIAGDGGSGYRVVEEPSGARRTLAESDFDDSGEISAPLRLYRSYPLSSEGYRETTTLDFVFQGLRFHPGANRHWGVVPSQLARASNAERIIIDCEQISFVRYWEDSPVIPLGTHWGDVGGASGRTYVVQTNAKVIERCLLMTTDPGDLVLDPTCGSGTTAYVAEQWGRRWITIDTSRVAIALARQRLMTAKFDRFRVKGEDEAGNGNGAHRPGIDPHPGFVYKTVPHITLGAIARNQNLDPIFEKHEPILDKALAACNAALSEVKADLRSKLRRKLAAKQQEQGKRAITDADRRRWELPKDGFEHWTVPFDTDADWPKALQKAVTAYREAWRAKMDEVNACIAANADQEELVDQPEAVKGVTRVSGPFTVEAVQPPEMSLSDVVAEFDGQFDGAPEELETGLGDGEYDRPPMALRRVEPRPDMDVKNIEAYLEQMTRLLRTDGVRFPNNKQMTFSRLDRLTGVASFLHAEGRWIPKGEADAGPEGPAEVVVAFGPQYGPITAKQVEECNRSAFRRGYTDLVFAGFSFDGPAQTAIEEIQRENPKMRIHLAHIRPDVNPAMDGLLKEQPGSQLFTVFGQPRVAMEGVDIYDPVTNEIRATGADKVAAWFLDGDYDGRVFCITQAFFPDKSAWDKLARSLKGVLDEDAFAAFSGTQSLPFPIGGNRRIAVKVIDPRGNEVMNVHELE